MKIRFFSPSENIELDKPIPSALSKNQYRAWSASEKRFLRDNWETKSPDELASLLGRTRSSIQCYASKVLALKKSPEAKYLAACRGQQKRKDAYTEAEKQYIRDNWQLKSTQEIADVLGRTRGSVKSMGQKKMGLKKTQEAFRALVKRPNAGQFKKGNMPQTTIYSNEPVIRPRHHAKTKRTYLYIRISYGKWQQYHQWMWIRDNGPIPPGHIVVFRNGDQMDVRPENLELITMKENRLRNSGSLRLSDGYVAHALAWHNPELQQEMLKHPELIELKRTELQLKRAIKHHDNAKPTKTR